MDQFLKAANQGFLDNIKNILLLLVVGSFSNARLEGAMIVLPMAMG